jgi:hypothetical protein
VAFPTREYRNVEGEHMKTVQERQQEKREEKLDLIRQQIKAGTLTVRKMTAAERAKYPARPAQPAKRKRF